MKYLRDCFWWYLGIVAWPLAMAMLERGHRHKFVYWLLGKGGMQGFADDWAAFRLCVQWNADGRPKAHAYLDDMEERYDRRATA